MLDLMVRLHKYVRDYISTLITSLILWKISLDHLIFLMVVEIDIESYEQYTS